MEAVVYTHEGMTLTVYNPKKLQYTDEATIHGKVYRRICDMTAIRDIRKGDLYLRKGRLSEKVNVAQVQIVQAFESAIARGTLTVPPKGTPEFNRFEEIVNSTIINDAAQLANKMGDLIIVDTW
jgi:hypothetical protein